MSRRMAGYGPRVKARDMERLNRIFGTHKAEEEKEDWRPGERTWRNYLCGECWCFHPDKERTQGDTQGHVGGISEHMGGCGKDGKRVGRCDWACEAYVSRTRVVQEEMVKKVRCVETGEVFASANQAEKALGENGVKKAIENGWTMRGMHFEWA